MYYFDSVIKLYFIQRPISVLGSSSSFSFQRESKLTTSLFVEKPYPGSNFNESIFEENIHMKNLFESEN